MNQVFVFFVGLVKRWEVNMIQVDIILLYIISVYDI